jgi:hypothetical protein
MPTTMASLAARAGACAPHFVPFQHIVAASETHQGKSRAFPFKGFGAIFEGFAETGKGHTGKRKARRPAFSGHDEKSKGCAETSKGLKEAGKGQSMAFKGFVATGKGCRATFKGKRRIGTWPRAPAAGRRFDGISDASMFNVIQSPQSDWAAIGTRRIRKANNASKLEYSAGFL